MPWLYHGRFILRGRLPRKGPDRRAAGAVRNRAYTGPFTRRGSSWAFLLQPHPEGHFELPRIALAGALAHRTSQLTPLPLHRPMHRPRGPALTGPGLSMALRGAEAGSASRDRWYQGHLIAVAQGGLLSICQILLVQGQRDARNDVRRPGVELGDARAQASRRVRVHPGQFDVGAASARHLTRRCEEKHLDGDRRARRRRHEMTGGARSIVRSWIEGTDTAGEALVPRRTVADSSSLLHLSTHAGGRATPLAR
mmetsp:Transcript_12595/g.26441  ORF Transcript_12595/g.26441 Transcript_12595/m.26441 type:complete len:253 (+) Transcript_12595:369-1127(+)